MLADMSPRGLPHVGAIVEKRALLSPYLHGNAVFLLCPHPFIALHLQPTEKQAAHDSLEC